MANTSTTPYLMMAASGLGLIGLVGCGAKETHQVSGRVQYSDGSPITGAVRVIRFQPTGDTTATVRKAASATIGEDGTYEAFTRRPGDGVFRGKYTVTFSVLTQPLGGKSLIQAYYTDARSTPFTVDIDDDKTDLNFELDKLNE